MTGKITSIAGNVVQVDFLEDPPEINELLSVEGLDLILEVFTSAAKNSFYCIPFSSIKLLQRGQVVRKLGKKFEIAAGKELLGRVINFRGMPVDGKGAFPKMDTVPVHREPPDYSEVTIRQEVLETGVKIVDFFTPILKGGKTGLFGGAGVGKTVLLSELMHNVLTTGTTKGKETVSVFA